MEGWHEFYLLVGGAAGALIGLLFVVASLAGHLESADNDRGARFYLTPTVFHLSVSLAFSALVLAPGLSEGLVGGLVAAGGLAGLAYSAMIGWALWTDRSLEVPHWSDPWFYAAIPALIYMAMTAAGVLVTFDGRRGLLALGAVEVALLMIGIRNAWDLITWIAPRAKDAPSP